MGYNRNGDVINEVTSSEIKKSLMSAIADGSVNLGSVIGATLSVPADVSTTWRSNCESAYASMLAEYRTSPNRFAPFFISTDQHGRGLNQHRFVNNVDVDGMEMLNINLGDSVTDVYGTSDINGFYDVIKQVKNYVGIRGNHEMKYGTQKYDPLTLNRTYRRTNLEYRFAPDRDGNYVVVDSEHGVKYLCLAHMVMSDSMDSYTHGFSTVDADWLIRELSADDNLDIVVVQHWFLKPATGSYPYKSRTDVVIENTLQTASYDYPLTQLLIARKTKGSGSYSDVNGVSHSYDFSGVKTNLLCTLHGHTHGEWYGKNGSLLSYCADWYGNNNSALFGMIDRKNSKLIVYKFDKSSVSDRFEMSL